MRIGPPTSVGKVHARDGAQQPRGLPSFFTVRRVTGLRSPPTARCHGDGIHPIQVLRNAAVRLKVVPAYLGRWPFLKEKSRRLVFDRTFRWPHLACPRVGRAKSWRSLQMRQSGLDTPSNTLPKLVYRLGAALLPLFFKLRPGAKGFGAHFRCGKSA